MVWDFEVFEEGNSQEDGKAHVQQVFAGPHRQQDTE